MRANALDLNQAPCGAYVRIKQHSQGVGWMIEHWRELRQALADNGELNFPELMRAEQLQRRRGDATGVFRIQELNTKCTTGRERVDGECRLSPEQIEACKARSKLELNALLSQQIEDWLVYRATLPLADAELNRQEAPMRAVIDVTNSGQLLQHYESAAAREIHKIFEYFEETRTAETLEESDATPELIETSATLASFGSPPESEAGEPDPEPEIVVDAASNPPTWPIASPSEEAEPVVLTVESTLKE